jgi:hypothetical protein
MRRYLLVLAGWLLILPLVHAAESDWITRSNLNAQILLEITARYNPESASSLGIEGHEAEVLDLRPRFMQREEDDLKAAIGKLEGLRAAETDARVKQDLDILIDAARQGVRSSELNRKYLLTFFDVPQCMFRGVQNLIDPRVP